MGVKDWVQIAAVVLMLAGLVWRGGQMTEQLSSIGLIVGEIRTNLDRTVQQQSRDGADIRVLKERADMQKERLQNHEARLSDLESSRYTGNRRSP